MACIAQLLSRAAGFNIFRITRFCHCSHNCDCPIVKCYKRFFDSNDNIYRRTIYLSTHIAQRKTWAMCCCYFRCAPPCLLLLRIAILLLITPSRYCASWRADYFLFHGFVFRSIYYGRGLMWQSLKTASFVAPLIQWPEQLIINPHNDA